jgi:hypothetical protein
MSLSASTLALFVILVPGLVFRFSIYHQSLVRRTFVGGNAIYSTIEVILLSVIVHLAFILLGSLLVLATFSIFGRAASLPQLSESQGDLIVTWGTSPSVSLTTFFLSNPMIALAYFVATMLIAYFLGQASRRVANWSKSLAKVLYGPIAPLASKDKTTIITCFVLTKIEDDHRRVMYQGLPREICLGEGNNIDHIVLMNPEKFYLKFDVDAPTTTRGKARPISSYAEGNGFLYISGGEIENVHFEGFYFSAS